MPVSPAFIRSFSDYVRSLSDWRRSRFDDDLRDPRHLRSANGMLELAEYIAGLSHDDPRLDALNQLATAGDEFVPGQQTAYEIGRFRFHDGEASIDGFLSVLVGLAERDAGESGRFGGPQVPGDDPWR
jgi:hypothetical protein